MEKRKAGRPKKGSSRKTGVDSDFETSEDCSGEAHFDDSPRSRLYDEMITPDDDDAPATLQDSTVYDQCAQKYQSDKDREEELQDELNEMEENKKRWLKAAFNVKSRPSLPVMCNIADELDLKLKVVKMWFENRRDNPDDSDESDDSYGEIDPSKMPELEKMRKMYSMPRDSEIRTLAGNDDDAFESMKKWLEDKRFLDDVKDFMDLNAK